MESFAQRAKVHLADYKRSVLGVIDDGTWSRNRRPYPHILPNNLHKLNILEGYRDAFWQFAAQKRIPLHTDFHHLNSSQALAFNLLYPPLVEQDRTATALVRSLTGHASAVARWQFEAVPHPAEGTNFDLLIQLESGRHVYVEVKFTELSFGSANPNDRRRAKLKNLYRPRLKELVEPAFLQEDAFFPNYQLFRNISYLQAEGDHVTFVVPVGNQSAYNHAATILDAALLPGVGAVRLVTVEDVVSGVLDAGVELPAVFTRHFAQFRAKYLWEDRAA